MLVLQTFTEALRLTKRFVLQLTLSCNASILMGFSVYIFDLYYLSEKKQKKKKGSGDLPLIKHY